MKSRSPSPSQSTAAGVERTPYLRMSARCLKYRGVLNTGEPFFTRPVFSMYETYPASSPQMISAFPSRFQSNETGVMRGESTTSSLPVSSASLRPGAYFGEVRLPTFSK